jgi:hypothetical protein
MSYSSDLEQVRKKAEIQGWRYQRTSSGHHQFYSPDKESIVTTSGTPGDVRGWLNFLAEMKRGGYRDDFGPLKVAIQDVIEKKEEVVPIPPPVSTPTVGVEQVKAKTVSAAEHVRSLLRNHPGQVFSIDEVFTKVKAVKKEATRVTVAQALKQIVDKGLGRRAGDSERAGLYQWGPKPKAIRAAPEPKAKESDEMTQLDEALAAAKKVVDALLQAKARLAAMSELKKLLRF